ncbi:hypothetical protein D3C81_1685200 [compost metagenome]
MVDQQGTGQRLPTPIDQAADYREGFHHANLLVTNSAAVEVIADRLGLNTGGMGLTPNKIEVHIARLVGADRYHIAPRF